jgi:hypothetical protein
MDAPLSVGKKNRRAIWPAGEKNTEVQEISRG